MPQRVDHRHHLLQAIVSRGRDFVLGVRYFRDQAAVVEGVSGPESQGINGRCTAICFVIFRFSCLLLGIGDRE